MKKRLRIRIAKGGESHLGFILSFVIFITFLLFVYTTLEPALKIRASKQPVLDFLKNQLIFGNSIINSNIIVMTIEGNPITPPNKNCVSLQNVIGGGSNQIPETYITNNQLKIKNDSKNFDYSRSGNSLQIGLWESGDLQTNGFFFKIYYSEALEQTPLNMEACHPVSDYTIGSLVEKQDSVFESGILNLITQYETDYEQLKTDLNLPEGSDFTFSFELADGTIIEPTGVKIPSTDVYATTFPLEYFDSDANPQIGFLTIKVW